MSRTRLASAAISALPALSALAGLSFLAAGSSPASAAAPAKPRKPEPSVVAPTDKLSPEQERGTFALPPGFEAQLVAAEPDIAKPMNLAFDAKGRLWVTDTVEYPFPVPEGQVGRDRIQVLSDLDPATGRARKVSTFATGLNVPLGVLPYGDGAVVYSVPQINRYRDTDGDGKADKVEPMIGPFHTTDTHGMTNNFTRGFDGWVYANHGFRNEDVLTGTDKSSIAMQSGSTYRFKPDGSKLQVFARGQVNPFGLCFDPRGDLYSADCHTRPQYLLLRGAVYPSFGKPDDGLGFGPEMCTHDHGSTAIAGTTYYDADQFPPEYRGNLFNGNPVTNAVDRDTLKWDGSTPTAVEAPDFMTSTDPWFRPVQVTLGPDGALYVADFYNKIIGHYEVDLKHPGRDRTSGRIWRVVYKGPDGKAARAAIRGTGFQPVSAVPSAQATVLGSPTTEHGLETRATNEPRLAAAPVLLDLTALGTAGLVAKLGDPNLTVRLLATNHLADKADPALVGPLEQAVRKPANWEQRVHAAWVLERTGKLAPDLLAVALADPAAEVRVHAMRILSERGAWAAPERSAATNALSDADAAVRRAAADALARHPEASAVKPLLAARAAIDAKDTHLLHAIRVSLRDQLAAPGVGGGGRGPPPPPPGGGRPAPPAPPPPPGRDRGAARRGLGRPVAGGRGVRRQGRRRAETPA